jgi:hypothetical protein
LSFELFSKNDLLPRKKLFASLKRNIGVHNSIPEYAPTAGISKVMTIPFHAKPFEKNFLKK